MPADAPSLKDLADRPLSERVGYLINLMRPAIQSDGGDIELVEVTEGGLVRVRLHGACVGCPSSSMTLQSGIERRLKMHLPEITAVQAIE